ncbi:hypothetical protein F5884DRAFT_874438 [Xylogone sp. PMI_703]|nr:hypothetical protein F5884DRAFT_874438 [Xylogone sp. PMI_703]
MLRLFSVLSKRRAVVYLISIVCCLDLYFHWKSSYIGLSKQENCLLGPPHQYSSSISSHTSIQRSNSTIAPACKGYPENSDIVIILKTGATEAVQRLPIQLITFLQCAQEDLVFFSDMEADIGSIHLHDALDSVVHSGFIPNSDFRLYHKQKEWKAAGGDIMSIPDTAEKAWDLDKYKFIHTLQKAYRMRPNKSWYFFIEADTYVVWANLFLWLQQLDPSEKLYMGSKVGVGEPPFAHGGSGYLLSRPSVEAIASSDVARDFDYLTRDACCGDQELAKVLEKKGIYATNSRPMTNGDKPRGIPYGEFQWCQPIVTMHHMNIEEMNDMWQMEQRRADPAAPLLIEELYYAFVDPYIEASRDDWDNISYTLLPDAPRIGYSFTGCRSACKADAKCVQYLHTKGECYLGSAFRLGGPRTAEGRRRWKSGWMLERIHDFRDKNRCTEISWKDAP